MSYVDEVADRIRAAVDPELIPDESNGDLLFRIYALLALSKGERVTGRDIHDAWSVWMSTVNPTHDAIRPYSDLDVATQREDEPYVRAVQSVARDLHA